MDDRCRRRRVLQASALAVAGLAGCTGDDGNGGETPTEGATASPTPEPAATPTPTAGEDPTATATTTPTATATGTPSPSPDQVVAVGKGGLNFVPETFSIATGDTVLWDWVGTGHNVSPGSQPDGADWPGDDDRTYGEGHTYAYTFAVAGTYRYHCDPHQGQGMTGSFTVG